MTCTYCGKDIDNGSKFCPACGQKLESPEEKPSLTAAAEAPSKPDAAVGLPGSTPEPQGSRQQQQPFVREMPEQRVVTGSPSYYQMCHSSGDAAGAARFSEEQPMRRNAAGDSAYDTAVQRRQQRSAAPKRAKEKEFFGKGAFIFCLIIIALLAGTAGAFGYLYFSLLGAI